MRQLWDLIFLFIVYFILFIYLFISILIYIFIYYFIYFCIVIQPVLEDWCVDCRREVSWDDPLPYYQLAVWRQHPHPPKPWCCTSYGGGICGRDCPRWGLFVPDPPHGPLLPSPTSACKTSDKISGSPIQSRILDVYMYPSAQAFLREEDHVKTPSQNIHLYL